MGNEQVQLDTGVELDLDLTNPSSISSDGNKLAVCLHPWSWLGGRKEDPVLDCVEEVLLEKGYHVIRFNSRGVGKSTGWASFTGYKEGQDLEALVQWALKRITGVKSLVIVGYSHGSLITTLHPVLPEIQTSHLLLSYPLGPRHWLTLFNSKDYSTRLQDLAKHNGANILAVYGDRDEFTGVENYRNWRQSLESPENDIKFVEIPGGSHFWRGRAGRQLQDEVGRWLP